MRCLFDHDAVPRLGVAVGVGGVAHVLGLHARVLTVDRGLYVLREYVVRHFRGAEPFEARAGLVAVADLVGGTPARRGGEAGLVAQFGQRVVVVCRVVRCRVHVACIHHREAHSVVEHLAVSFQSYELLFAVDQRVVGVDQRLDVFRVAAEALRGEYKVCVAPHDIEIFSRGGGEQFLRAAFVTGPLRVVVAVYVARGEVEFDLGRRGEVVGVVHHVYETLVRYVYLVHSR